MGDLQDYADSLGHLAPASQARKLAALKSLFSFAHNPVSFTVTAPELAGRTLTDLFGGARFPSFDAEGRVTFTLGTQTFFWLKVGEPVQPVLPSVPTTTSAIPTIRPTGATGPIA